MSLSLELDLLSPFPHSEEYMRIDVVEEDNGVNGTPVTIAKDALTAIERERLIAISRPPASVNVISTDSTGDVPTTKTNK